ncbi:hypothetical protein Rm378p143 [Rhodothermus phage RM378]|nr:hypothetical protein Rm378p143 [Rhodothermus phage RM378]
MEQPFERGESGSKSYLDHEAIHIYRWW